MEGKLKKILKYFGIENQVVKLHEEVGELTLEIARRDYYTIIEELADVKTVLEQIQIYFEIDDAEIDIVKKEKIDRTLARIKEGYYEEHR